MSGPPYPRPNPAPGSNAIGSFTIGVSPIGTINPFDWWETVISQYANSERLTGILQSFAEAMDLTEEFDNFYDFMWNVLTATGYGLDVWGRIVGVSRTLQLSGTGSFVGFEEAGSWTGFGPAAGAGGFYGGGVLTTNFNLLDPDYRTLILAKAATNICDGSIPAINAILMNLFPGRGNCYVVDNQNMTMAYTFEFTLTAVELAIMEQSGAVPRPVGVTATVVQI